MTMMIRALPDDCLQVPLEGVAELAEGESLTFDFVVRGHRVPAFVLRRQGQLRGWLNNCPHWDVDLDLGEGRFFAPEIDRIFCRNHGALFEPEGGKCVAGPCVGRGLLPVQLEQRGEQLWAVLEAPLQFG